MILLLTGKSDGTTFYSCQRVDAHAIKLKMVKPDAWVPNAYFVFTFSSREVWITRFIPPLCDLCFKTTAVIGKKNK